MLIEDWFHGSPKWSEILIKGFDIDAPRRTDPGDFGWGVYFTKNIAVAYVAGGTLKVGIDIQHMAEIPNPYFLVGAKIAFPVTEEEKLFFNLAFDKKHNMLTLHGSRTSRTNVSKQISQEFLARGYTGIRTKYNQGELVVFDPKAIINIEPL